MSDVAVFVPLAVAFILGIVVPRGRGWIALAGVAVAVGIWAAALLVGAFDDDTEGTAALLSLVYAVPLYALLWATAVGAGYIAHTLWARRRATTASR
ncbi:MAG TPA: hypothetical protein VG106_01975 [Vicinamibacterales bacterium]|nr:hypothetical protein [Vicinamibacterales bacterium]